jgi:molybdopterin converting factor small subunit
LKVKKQIMTIAIELKLFATLQKFAPQASHIQELDTGTSVRALVQQLGIPEKKAKLIFINSRKVTLDSILKDGDRLGIFPPVGGG